MRAFSLIRDQPWYRREAFAAGLKAAGHDVQHREPDRYDRDTLLVIWNRYSHTADLASRVEAGGGRVLCCENGYIGHGAVTPKFAVHTKVGPRPNDFYSIGMGFHNDDTRWVAGTYDRWAKLGLELKPWRAVGQHVLILPNRAFGVPGRMMPADWADRLAARLAKQTGREIRIRRHPGNDQPQRPLIADLDGAWCAFVWSSSAGVHALFYGVPTFCEGPFWSMKSAAASGSVEAPTMPDRSPAFRHLAWGQWECQEVASGIPFRHLFTS